MSWLRSLRRQPREKKVHVSLAVAVVVTLTVAALWSVTVPVRFAALSAPPEEATPGPFARLETLLGTVRGQAGALLRFYSSDAEPAEVGAVTPQEHGGLDIERLIEEAAGREQARPAGRPEAGGGAPRTVRIATTSASHTAQ